MGEWFLEKDWSKVQVGDLVELVNGDNVLIVTVTGTNSSGSPWIIFGGGGLAEKSKGWTLYVQAKPVELPTELGFYVDKFGGLWTLSRGGWSNTGLFYSFSDMSHCSPLTKLEPVPETAKKVLDAVKAAFWGFGTVSSAEAALVELRAEFGVTNE